MKTNERKSGFDILKAICSFLIVIIHAPLTDSLAFLMPLTRIAVPVFFMISGYFYLSVCERKKENNQIRKILKYVIISNLLYFAVSIAMNVYQGNNIRFSFNLFRIFVLNDSPFGVHLWYLSALLYTLVIVAFFNKIKALMILYIAVPFLLVGDLIMGKYSLLVFGREFPVVCVKNFLFVGLPWFTTGILIFKYKEKISNVPKFIKIILLALFLVLTLIENQLLLKFKLSAERQHFISTIFSSVLIFVLFADFSDNKRIFKMSADVGKFYSTLIYILHPAVILVMKLFITKLGIYEFYSNFEPFIVWCVTLSVSILIMKIFHKFKRKEIQK